MRGRVSGRGVGAGQWVSGKTEAGSGGVEGRERWGWAAVRWWIDEDELWMSGEGKKSGRAGKWAVE
jgi:hypothetical protein